MARKKAQKTEDVLSLIEADHSKVEELFGQMEEGKKFENARKCFQEIYREISLHAHAEELVFYPAMREYEETEGFIEESEEEHSTAKILLEEMRKLEPGDREFETKFNALKDSFLHHVEEEESEIFDAVRECMEEDEFQQLGQEFQAVKTKMESEVEAALTR